MGTAGVPAMDPRKDDVGAQLRRGDHGYRCAAASARATSSRAPPSRTPSPRSPPPAARPTRCCTCWPWPTRPASRSTIDDFDVVSTRTPLLVRHQAGRPLRGGRPATAPAASPLVAQRLVRGRLRRWRRADGRPVVPSARRRPRARDARPGRGPPARSAAQADRRPGDPAGQPGARGLRGQGRRARAASTAGPARVFDGEEDACTRSPTARSGRATWS